MWYACMRDMGQCCSAMTTLLESIKKTPQLYPHLEPFLVPMLKQILSPDANGDYQCMEFMEDGLEILTYLTYYAPQISGLVWSLFEPLCKSFHDWAMDYLHNINLPLDNYISRSNDTFLSNPQNVQAIYDVIAKSITGPDSSDRDCVEGCKLSESLVLNCPGHLDQYIPQLLGLVVARLRDAEARQAEGKTGMRNYCRTELMKMMCICLYYNPLGALQSLEGLGATQQLFQTLFTSLSDTQSSEDGQEQLKTHFRGLHDQKIAILGLASIFKVPVAQMPTTVSQGMPTIISALVTLEDELAKNRKRKEEEEEEEEEEDDDEEEGVLDVADEEDEDGEGEEDIDAVLRKLAMLKVPPSRALLLSFSARILLSPPPAVALAHKRMRALIRTTGYLEATRWTGRKRKSMCHRLMTSMNRLRVCTHPLATPLPAHPDPYARSPARSANLATLSSDIPWRTLAMWGMATRHVDLAIRPHDACFDALPDLLCGNVPRDAAGSRRGHDPAAHSTT